MVISMLCESYEDIAFKQCRIYEVFYPEVGQKRSRKVVSRSNSRSTIKYPSWKARRMVQCESKHELAACLILDTDVSVDSFQEQPCRISYQTPIRTFAHYPDFLVHKKDGKKELWEVKDESEVVKKDIRFRSAVMSCLLKEYGYQYHLVSSKELKENPRADNSRLLLKFGRNEISEIESEYLLEYFVSKKVKHWGEFEPYGERLKDRAVLCRLILDGIVSFDSHSLIEASTKLWIASLFEHGGS